MRLCWRFSSDFRASFGSSSEFLPFFLSFPLASPMPFFANSACIFTSISLLLCLALGVRAAAHLLWWLLLCLPWGHYFCSRGAVSSFSSYCYGCCQLLLPLLGVFFLLVLVHLQFPLGVMRLAALLRFPCWLLFSEWQTVREALLFLLSSWWL